MRRYLLVAALLALVLSACRIETNLIMNIEEDGSAEVGAEIGFDEEFLSFMEESGGTVDDIFSDIPQFGDGDGEPIERVEGDMTYYGFIAEVDDLSEFDPNTDGETFSTFEYTFDDSSASLNAELVATDLGEMGGGDLGIDPSMITDQFFSANLVVKMPGDVVQHDADEVRSDGTLVWNVPLSGSKSVFAQSEFGSSSSNLVLIILGLVLFIGIIAAIVATVVSRRESEKAVQAAAASHAASEPAATGAEETLELDSSDAVAEEMGTEEPAEDQAAKATKDDEPSDDQPAS